MKLVKALLVLALVLAFATPVYAETQNVKVSGALDIYGFYRGEYDLTPGNDASVLPVGTALPASNTGNANQRSDADSYLRSNTQIEVAADLTDGVSTVINVVNQRDWNANDFVTGTTTTATTTATAAGEFDVALDLAYVKLKEVFYAPLTLTLGRQDLWFGRGFLVGNNNTAWDRQGVTQADEYSVTTAFDAIRGTLDFNPWTVDVVYSKIDENSHNAEDDKDLWVINANYKFSEYNMVAEGYYIIETDKNAVNGTTGTANNDTYTFGARVQFDPIAQMTLGAELAFQGGNYRAALTSAERDREAWAADLFATYRFQDNPWKATATIEYVMFSGEEDTGAGSTGDYGAWNGLYRGLFWTAYADFREFTYLTGDAVDQPASTNQEFVQLKGSIQPMDDITLEGSTTFLWNDETVHETAGNLGSPSRSKDIGIELDLQATYDYTEDVTFGLLAGWFFPGDFYSSSAENAVDVVSSVKVTF